MFCASCSGHRLTSAPFPIACPVCRGSGLDRRTLTPMLVLCREAEKVARAALEYALPDEEPRLWARAGDLYAAAALEAVRGTRGRADLAAAAYRCYDAAGQRETGRAVLGWLGYQLAPPYMDARHLAAWAEMPMGGVQ